MTITVTVMTWSIDCEVSFFLRFYSLLCVRLR